MRITKDVQQRRSTIPSMDTVMSRICTINSHVKELGRVFEMKRSHCGIFRPRSFIAYRDPRTASQSFQKFSVVLLSLSEKIVNILVSLTYNPLPVTNNTIYDLYDPYWEMYNNEDYDIYDAEWNTTDIFGCACGIGACVNEEKTNI